MHTKARPRFHSVATPSPRPDVSIVMPVFNAVDHLATAVESVLAQETFALWELIIVDDGSTDGSVALAHAYAERNQPIVLLQHPDRGNRGTSASRNLAIKHAKAPVLAFLDADDVWLPHMLHSQLSFLRTHSQAAMVYAHAERTWEMALPCLEEEGVCGPNELPPLLPSGTKPGLLHEPHPLDWFLADETLVPCTCTTLVYTAVAREIGGFVEALDGLYDDQAFYAKLMLRYPVAVTTRCVARYRKHYESCCAQAWDNDDLQSAARARFLQWLGEYKLTLTEEPALAAD